MCSLGHHDHPDDIRPAKRRRRLGTAMSQALAETPRPTLAARKAAKHEQLRADLAAEREPFQPDMEQGQFELIPPDEQHLPDWRIGEHGLPDPRTLYYSAASER